MEFKINKAILVLEKEVESMNVELQIYKILKDGNYHTSDEFAKILGISDKTVRKKINNMRNILDVDVKKGVGLYCTSNLVSKILGAVHSCFLQKSILINKLN